MWRQFVKDREVANFGLVNGFTGPGRAAFGHWLYNPSSGKLPGLETAMGYRLGMQIAKA